MIWKIIACSTALIYATDCQSQELLLDLSSKVSSTAHPPAKYSKFSPDSNIYIEGRTINLLRHYTYIATEKTSGKTPGEFNFNKFLIFENDTFLKNTDEPLPPIVFDSILDFSNTNFEKGLHFAKCIFFKSTDFGKSLYNGVTIEECVFKKNVEFSRNNLSNSAIQNNIFSDRTWFFLCDFGSMQYGNNIGGNKYKIALFHSCFFNNSSFKHNSCDDLLAFTNTIFNKKFVLYNDTLSAVSFSQAWLPDTLVFASNKLNGEIDLSDINVKDRPSGFAYTSDRTFEQNKPPYKLVLYGSDMSKFKLNYAYFKLLPIRCRYSRDFSPLTRDDGISLYEALLKNFKDRGQLESYEKLDVEYQRYKWETGLKYIRWIGWVDDVWWRFGYSKERVFLWTLLFLVLFTIPTIFCLSFLNRSVYSLAIITEKETVADPYSQSGDISLAVFSKPSKKIWYSLVYTSVIFLRLTLKIENMKFDSKPLAVLGTIYVMIIYTTGIICLGYMANFILH